MLSLGISYQMHDSAACLARDGQIVFAISEERLSRAKHDSRFPVRAIQACLDHAKIGPNDLDYVAFGWPKPGASFRHDSKCYLLGRLPRSIPSFSSLVRHTLRMWRQQNGWTLFREHFGPVKAKPRFIDHHESHAISAYAFSGFDEATVVIVDGRGAWEASSIWHGRDGRLTHVLTVPWPNSLGLFYAALTDYLGFARFSDEWKVMGLAPYGGPGINLRPLIDPADHPYQVDAHRLLGRNGDVSGIESLLGPRRRPESDIDPRHKDLAFAVQDNCEQAMLHLVKFAVQQTGCRKLCLAGGVALNSKANGKIWSSGFVDELFIQPAAADEGIALGAALAPHLETDRRLPMTKLRHIYWGPEYQSDEIAQSLKTYKIRHTRLNDPAATAAELLAQGKIIGWFQGRMEFGPRALGCRSILADPRDPEMKDKVNNAVKFREAWRPFAPSMIRSAAPDFLEKPCESPFMILTFQVKPEKRAVIPAVTHVDGSVRVQMLDETDYPLYGRLLAEFGRRTGVPVVMNTSFNLRGEAIVCSPTDAIRTFYSSSLDALVLGDYLVEK